MIWRKRQADKRRRERCRERWAQETILAKLERWRAAGKLSQAPAGAEVMTRGGVDFVVKRYTSEPVWICPVTLTRCLSDCTGPCARQQPLWTVITVEVPAVG